MRSFVSVLNRILLKKCIHDAKWLFFACCLALFGYSWFRVWLVSQLAAWRFKRILSALPEDWKTLAPVDVDWMATYTGRIARGYEEPLVIASMAIWAIARGSDSVSGEVGRGTMEMLLAQPVSRVQIMSHQMLVTLAGVVVLSLAVWAGSSVGIHAHTVEESVQPTWTVPILRWEIRNPFSQPKIVRRPLHEKVDWTSLWPASCNLLCFGAFLAGFATLLSSWDRHRWRTIGLAVAFFYSQAILEMAARGVKSLHWLSYATVFTAYEPQDAVKRATQSSPSLWDFAVVNSEGAITQVAPMGYNLILLLLAFACFAAAFTVFARRDLPAPL